MQSRRPDDVRTWLKARPSLEEMREAFPHEWAQVERELAAVVDSGDPAALKAYVRELAQPVAPPRGARPSPSGVDAALSSLIRRHMAAESVRHLSVRAASGVATGRVRFNLFNGWLAQRLLFASGLERKPVSMARFKLLWPVLWQRRRLMPLVEPQGIYCFYSAALVRELAGLIDGRSCIEIAAGDGTLSRFLNAAGTPVTATDDHSWSAVTFPASVERRDAKAALQAHAPQVVLCSWPPAGNDFERMVFRTPSVERYIVIGSRHEVGAGDWAAYRGQDAFDMRDDERLAGLVLPPEIDPMVRVFDRRP